MILHFTQIPTRWIGPITLKNEESVMVPMATYESPLWASTQRGARACAQTDGVVVTIMHHVMTRSLLLKAASAEQAITCAHKIKQIANQTWEQLIATTTSHGTFDSIHVEVAGPLLFVRVGINPKDASGHNMVTRAAEAITKWLCQHMPELTYESVSGNYCTDKKVSAVNGILGRGYHVCAEVELSAKTCKHILNTTPERLHNLNYHKNWVGSTLAGSVRSANAHFANMLLAIYLATGQDAANIIEGSQGTVYTTVKGENLYFCVTLPNIIMGTVGNGKHLQAIADNLARIGGDTQRLVRATAAAVLCGELSLLAALTNEGTLVDTHMRLERR